MKSRYRDAVVLARRQLTDRIAEFQIGARDGAALEPSEAGSHIEVRFGGPSGVFLRHYSLIGSLSADRQEDAFWRIAVQREDRARGSSYIHANFRNGTSLQVSRPISAFKLGQSVRHALLVAGGIGITPILPMVRSLALRRRPFTFLYAGRSKEDMAYVEEVQRMGQSSVMLHEQVKQGLPNLSALFDAQPDGTEVFVCGPGAMIEAVRRAAREHGWADDRVHFEAFNAAHRPEDTDLTIRLRDGRQIRVGAGTTILDALDEAGIETLSDCRRGECGLCGTKVLSGGDLIDHRDSFLSPDEKATGEQMCICVSRTKPGATLTLDVE